MLNGIKVKSVVIRPVTRYPLYVAGTQVTSANADDITGAGITGKVSYNAATKTLTLDGATITGISAWHSTDGVYVRGINSDESIKINLIGNNQVDIQTETMDYENWAIISEAIAALDIQIAGSGKLMVTSAVCNQGGTPMQDDVISRGISAYGTLSILGNATVEIFTSADSYGSTYTHALKCNLNTIPAIYAGAALMEGNDKPTASKVSKLTISNKTYTTEFGGTNTFSDAISKPYVSIAPSGSTGLTTLSEQGIKVWGGKGVIQIDTHAVVETHGRASLRNTVQVYNMQGQLVHSSLLLLQGVGGQVSVPAGIYIVQIGSAAEKVMVR